MYMRDFEVEVLGSTRLGEIEGSWAEVIGERDPILMTVCEFGLAEEVIAMIAFADGSFEVGIGEAIRPYILLYRGADRDAAHSAWWDAVRKSADDPIPLEEAQEYHDEFVEGRQSETIQWVADKFEITTDEVHFYLTQETIREGSKADAVYREYYALLDRQWKAFVS